MGRVAMRLRSSTLLVILVSCAASAAAAEDAVKPDPPALWDGQAADRIVKIIRSWGVKHGKLSKTPVGDVEHV